MNKKQDTNRIRISSFCNVDFHTKCKVNDTQCRCNCHFDTFTFDDENDIKNIIVRVSYDAFMANNSDPLVLYVIFSKTFEKLGYTVVRDENDTEDKTISVSKIEAMTNICVEINERSKVDGWGYSFPEKLANEWNVLANIYQPSN